jgi:integrase
MPAEGQILWDKTCGISSRILLRSLRGRPWVPNEVTKQFIRIRRSIGLDLVRLHVLRHFTATRFLSEGVPVRTVSGRLGHANAATTLGVYAHFVEESDRDAAEKIGSMLTPTTKGRSRK